MPDTWIATLASGRSIAKLPTLLTIKRPQLAAPERRVETIALGCSGVWPVINGSRNTVARCCSCSRYWPITSTRSLRVPLRAARRRRRPCVRCRRRAGSVHARRRTRNALRALRAERHAHLDATRRRQEALPLEVLPRQLVALGSDQREHLVGAAVLAHQRRGEAEPPPRLDARGGAEHRCGQQVHLVVDDQAEAALVEQVEVRERVELALAMREDLVGRDGDRPDLLLLAGVLADLVGWSATSSRALRGTHCRTATVLVVSTSVLVCSRCIAARPTTVLPAPHGSTTTPQPPRSLPPAWNAAAAALLVLAQRGTVWCRARGRAVRCAARTPAPHPGPVAGRGRRSDSRASPAPA